MKNNFGYVDGFIIPMPRTKLALYKKWARLSSKVWKEYGAISYAECVGDGLKPGKVTSFPRSVKLKKGEVVIFAWATYKSKAHRDRLMKKVMNDPRFEPMMKNMPFDGMRMIWGGFKPFVKA